jgi:hypothetical protein
MIENAGQLNSRAAFRVRIKTSVGRVPRVLTLRIGKHERDLPVMEESGCSGYVMVSNKDVTNK